MNINHFTFVVVPKGVFANIKQLDCSLFDHNGEPFFTQTIVPAINLPHLNTLTPTLLCCNVLCMYFLSCHYIVKCKPYILMYIIHQVLTTMPLLPVTVLLNG